MMSNPPNPIATPPSTTLSTPSPTELHDTNPLSTSTDEMSALRLLRPIYLIVATTPVTTPSGPRLGIGLKGSLPWPMIKPDMNYFRRVTTDGREQNPPSFSYQSTLTSSTRAENEGQPLKTINSVIMGRKTYESIPAKFRPLPHRRNHIITRSDPYELAERYMNELIARNAKRNVSTRSTTKAAETISKPKSNSGSNADESPFDIMLTATPAPDVERIYQVQKSIDSPNDPFVPFTVTSSVNAALFSTEFSPYRGSNALTGLLVCIGGAEIYKLLLEDTKLRGRLRVLQTEIRKGDGQGEFECDTFWPEEMDADGSGWREVDREVVEGWTGIEVPQGGEEWLGVDGVKGVEGGVKIRVRGWVPREEGGS